MLALAARAEGIGVGMLKQEQRIADSTGRARLGQLTLEIPGVRIVDQPEVQDGDARRNNR